MRERKLKKSSFYKPTFTVIRGSLGQAAGIDSLVSTAWNFAKTALWNECNFSKTEIETSKLSIKAMLEASTNPTRCYNVFCQRVILARQYVLTSPVRYIPLPSVWLDKENALGFVGTKAWYLKIRDVRASLPNYKIELKAIGVALIELNENPTVRNFQYWKNYFIDKKATALLNLFLQSVANQQFSV